MVFNNNKQKESKMIKFDSEGKLYFNDDGEVYYQFRSNSRFYYLGSIKDGVFTSKKKKKDLFRKNNSFAFNNQLILEGDFNILHTIYEKRSHFYIAKQDILKYGEIMQFKRIGQEKQIFVPLNAFYMSKDEAIKNAQKNVSYVNATVTSSSNFGNKDCTQILLFEKH